MSQCSWNFNLNNIAGRMEEQYKAKATETTSIYVPTRFLAETLPPIDTNKTASIAKSQISRVTA
jgi:hypothetical protein